jgi:hypothetical protein
MLGRQQREAQAKSWGTRTLEMNRGAEINAAEKL